MWLSLIRGDWSSLVVIPASAGASAKAVTAALGEIAGIEDVERFKIVDAVGASVAEGARLANDLAAAVASGTRAVAAVDPLVQSLSGVPLIMGADAALLVVELGVTDFDSVRSAIDIIGRHRILGTVALSSKA